MTLGDWIDAILLKWQLPDPVLNVRTSGTSGRPKLCPHRVADLMEEARFFAGLLGCRHRVVSMVPADHIYGLIWTALLPEVLEVSVLTSTGNTAIELSPGDLVVAVPDQWRALGRRSAAFPDDVVGVSAAAPLALADAEQLLRSGLTTIIEVYGASETGGIGYRHAPDRPYTLLPRWQFAPGLDHDEQIVSTGGTVVLLPDHIVRIGDRLNLGQRRDGAVQVGGLNIWPAQVAETLCRHEGVAQAAVRLGSNGRLKAFLVPKEQRSPDRLLSSIAEHAAANLPAHARPVAYHIGRALPVGALGKSADWT